MAKKKMMMNNIVNKYKNKVKKYFTLTVIQIPSESFLLKLQFQKQKDSPSNTHDVY